MLNLDEKQIYLYTSSLSEILDIRSNQTFIFIMERMDKWNLLHIGTAYLEVHTFKWKDYVTVRDFSTTTNALSKEILELEKENKKLKGEIKDLVERNMEYEKKYNIVLSKINKLEAENEWLKNTLYYVWPTPIL